MNRYRRKFVDFVSTGLVAELMVVSKIISGGQTGADREALDWARENGVEHGGWCPAGRIAEDGRIADVYLLEETPSDGYSQRTEWNVRDSDGTVIFSRATQLTGGSQLTQKFAKKWKRPYVHISENGDIEPAQKLRTFLDDNLIQTLNFAGPRVSSEAGICEFVRRILDDAFDSA